MTLIEAVLISGKFIGVISAGLVAVITLFASPFIAHSIAKRFGETQADLCAMLAGFLVLWVWGIIILYLFG
jgi:uncharacterized membrane protein